MHSFWLSRAVRSARIVLAAAGAMVLSACTVMYAPKPAALETPLPKIDSPVAIALVNAQTDRSARELGKAGWGTMQGDLYSWTESALTLIRSELARAGAPNSAGGVKTLKVTVTEAKLGVSGLNYAGVPICGVGMRVETGAGDVVDSAAEANALSPPGACDKALAMAVEKALRSKSVQTYIRP